MILPIYALGQKVLKKKAVPVEGITNEIKEFVDSMWETMYNAQGVGLAAPQVGQSLRLFVVDTQQMYEEADRGIKNVFINPTIIEYSQEEEPYEEGCLSIPDIRADVNRPERIKIEYFDDQMVKHTKDFRGIEARVIQHEFDHLEGILFIEKLGPIKRRRLQRRLDNIRNGQITADYRLRFAP